MAAGKAEKTIRKTVYDVVVLALIGSLGALNYEAFVFPNNFAPAGLNGILTIIRYVFGINFGYMLLIANIPLLILALVFLDRHYAFNTFIYIISFSVAEIVLKGINISRLCFYATDGGEKVMAAVAAGVFNGFNYSVALRLGGSTGGLDIAASIINRRKPEFTVAWILFVINVLIAALSFFVYGMVFTPVILCIIYSYVTSRVNDAILKGIKSAAKFEIVTSQPDELAYALMAELHHGCTVLPAKGMYSNTNKSLLICVVNRRQIADFERVIKKFEDTFVIVSHVTSTYGNFKHIK